MQSNITEARNLILELLRPALDEAALCVGELDDSFNLIESGLYDSIAFLSLIACLEERADLEFDLYDVDPDEFTTLGGLIHLLIGAMSATAPSGRAANG